MPLAGLVPMVNMQLGEVVFGGVGAGLYGMLMFAILAVFIAGLMVGRTPEYLGKKIEGFEVKMAMLAVAGPGGQHPRLHRPRQSVGEWGTGDAEQPGRARLLRDPLPLHLGDRQQRLGVRGHRRQQRLLQHDRRPGDADRALPDDRADAGDRRLAGAPSGACRRASGPSRPPAASGSACWSA